MSPMIEDRRALWCPKCQKAFWRIWSNDGCNACGTTAERIYVVRMDKHRSTWCWFTTNPQGGGFGSTHCGTKKVALQTAIRNIPVGASYLLVTNGREQVLTR